MQRTTPGTRFPGVESCCMCQERAARQNGGTMRMKSAVLGIALLVLASISQASGQASKRVIYYYQTLTDLSPVINNLNPNTQKPFATDIILAAFHLGNMSDGTLIHLNRLPPDDPTFNTVWQQLGQLQSMGVSVHMMLGGAAQGSYSSLF